MSQLALLALAALVGLLIWRNFAPALAQQKQPIRSQRREATTLRRDPETGVYRPIDDRD